MNTRDTGAQHIFHDIERHIEAYAAALRTAAAQWDEVSG